MDAREELRRRLDSGALSPEDAQRALAAVDVDADRAALASAERWGRMTREESLAAIERLGVPEEAVREAAARMGVPLDDVAA